MTRAIDHLVLTARDLPTLAEAYGRLGFRVGGRNRHPWGTENHIVQFDGSFLELIGLGAHFRRLDVSEAAAPFANTIEAFLAECGGLVQVALQSHDARADAERLAATESIRSSLLYFGRTAEGPDGRPREVSFTLAFAADRIEAAPEFFLCQHHRPENFWSEALQDHPNTARRLLGVTLVDAEPARRAGLLGALFGSDAVTETAEGLRVTAGADVIEVVRRERAASAGSALTRQGFVAYRVGVASLDAVRRCLDAAGLPYDARERAVVVGPEAAGGAVLGFETIVN